MTWFKRIVAVLFLIAFVVLVYSAYRHFVQTSRPGGDPMGTVPPSAGLVLRTENPQELWSKLQETNIIWERLVEEGILQDADSALRSVDSLLQDQKALEPLLRGDLVISLHSVGSHSLDLQFAIGLPGSSDPKEVRNGLKEVLGGLRERSYEGSTLYEADLGEGKLAFAFEDKNLILSRSAVLVEDAVRHMKKGDLLVEKEGFRDVASTTGSGMDAGVFVHYSKAERMLAAYLREPFSEQVTSKGGWARWGALDLLLRSRSMLLTGFTDPGKSDASYLSVLREQEPRMVKIPEVLPGRTAFFNALGLSDVEAYLDSYESYLETNNRAYGREKGVERISDSCDCKVRKKATSWIGHEVAAAYIEPDQEETLKENALIALRTFDVQAAERSLRDLTAKGKAEPLEEGIPGKEDLDLYRSPHTGLYRKLFGRGFPELEKPYFILRGDHVFFAEKKQVLRELLRDRELGRQLGSDVDYDSFSDKLSQRSNLLLYSNIARSPYLLTPLLQEEARQELKKRVDLLRKFQAFGVQFSSRPNDRLYSNIHLEYDPVYKKETASLWEVALDTSLRSRPWTVENHYTEALEAFVQDVSDRVYLVSNTGEVLWKKQVDGPIMGEVRQIDLYRNGKLQLLFNTRNKVHLLDRKGRYVEDFPLELPEPATAPMALFDYANNKRYRILVPCMDKKIHYYNKHGKELDGWEFDGTESKMLRPPQHIRIDQKDYILVTDSVGEVLLLNRRGNERYDVDETIAPSKHTPLVVNERKDIGSSELVYTDTSGAVVKLRFEGERSRLHLKEGMDEPFFFDHKDLENDGQKEFIIVEGKELGVYGSDEEKRFGYAFDSTITHPPQFFRFPEGEGKLGVIEEKNAQAYLFDKDGSLHSGLPLFGTTPFSIGDIDRDGYQELLIGSEAGDLYSYRLN